MIFYLDNRVDGRFEEDPKETARKFIEAVEGGFDISGCRASMEFAFRWWLSDPEGYHVSWEDGDSDQLMNALGEVITPKEKTAIWDKLTEGLR